MCLRAWYQVRFFWSIFGHSRGLVQGEGGAPVTVPLHDLRVTSHVLHRDVPLGWYQVRLFWITFGHSWGAWGAPLVRYLCKTQRSLHGRHVWEMLKAFWTRPGVRDIPAKLSRHPRFPPLETRRNKLFDPHPFAWKTPTPPRQTPGPKVSQSLCSFFLPDSISGRGRCDSADFILLLLYLKAAQPDFAAYLRVLSSTFDLQNCTIWNNRRGVPSRGAPVGSHFQIQRRCALMRIWGASKPVWIRKMPCFYNRVRKDWPPARNTPLHLMPVHKRSFAEPPSAVPPFQLFLYPLSIIPNNKPRIPAEGHFHFLRQDSGMHKPWFRRHRIIIVTDAITKLVLPDFSWSLCGYESPNVIPTEIQPDILLSPALPIVRERRMKYPLSSFGVDLGTCPAPDFRSSSGKPNRESEFANFWGRSLPLLSNWYSMYTVQSSWTSPAHQGLRNVPEVRRTMRCLTLLLTISKRVSRALWVGTTSQSLWPTIGKTQNQKNPGVPHKQKIAVNKFWVQESEIGEEYRQFWTWILGVNFLGGPKPWKNKAEKFAIKIRHQNSLRNSPAIFLKFAGPK